MSHFNFLPAGCRKIFFSGILGASMSGIALYCLSQGYEIIGSDTGENGEIYEKLNSSGVHIYKTHSSDNVRLADCFVYTAAIASDNPELIYAKENGIPCFCRAEFLGNIAGGFTNRIGISGTHGKSTTCGFTVSVYNKAGENVLPLIGAENACGGKAAGMGAGTVIFEACEYKRSFLRLRPDTAVILNIEKEHTDCYKDEEEATKAYREFAENSKLCILSADNRNTRKLDIPGVRKIYYSTEDKRAEVYGKITSSDRGFYTYDTYFEGEKAFGVRLNVPGKHNVCNALAASACAYYNGIKPEDIRDGITDFSGMKRRFQFIGMCGESPVYDDYAHHPTEVRGSLITAREMGFERIVTAFQPHTFSRTKEFFSEFAEVFSEYSDITVFADIFAARETNTYGVTSKMLAGAVKNGIYADDIKKIPKILEKYSGKGTVIITMGAGKLDKTAKTLCKIV